MRKTICDISKDAPSRVNKSSSVFYDLQACQLIAVLTLLFFSTFPFILKAQVKIDLIECPGCLWIAHNDSVYEWLPAGEDYFAPVGIFNLPYESLAVAHVKKADTVLNTYILQDFENENFKYWNGINWADFDLPEIDEKVIGMGGFGDFLYLLINYNIGDSRVFYFNGDTLKQIYAQSNTAGADIAVDSLGRVWLCSGTPSARIDQFKVIDSTGKTLKTYALSEPIGDLNLYGMALANDTIYIGVGPNAQVHPSSIMSFVVRGDSAYLVQVTRQMQRSIVYSDLASYKPGVPDRAPAPKINATQPRLIAVYPNPTSGLIYFKTNLKGSISFELFDQFGKLMLSQTILPSETIDISHLAPGSYPYRCRILKVVEEGQLVKIPQ